jgi:HD-like signal output (HDOD) protein
MNNQSQDTLRKRLEGLDQMPTIPVILYPLLRHLEQPLDRLDLQQIVDLISQDESLAAQCLHMANSPLFGLWQPVDSIRSAVALLGMQRVREIAVSCSVLQLLPSGAGKVDPKMFWEHSLACALVCRQFAHRINFADPGKAYLCGLLHDLGIVAHLWIVPKEFQSAYEQARTQGIPLHEAEMTTLGVTHCDTGKAVADRWHLTPDLVAVLSCHHNPSAASVRRDLVALVSLSDLLCRMSGLGHGYVEQRQINFIEEPAFAILLQECPVLKTFDWARFTFELEAYMEEVHRLVAVLYSSRS